MELISVIVPVYKVEKYLKKCVDSIRNQIYQNLEILLGDDGFPDDIHVSKRKKTDGFYSKIFGILPRLYRKVVVVRKKIHDWTGL